MADLLDPTSIQDELLTTLSEMNGGAVVNSSSPASNLTEATASLVNETFTHIRTLHRKRFINNATVKKDIYPHLSDRALTMAFAMPSTINLTVYFELNYLRNNAVAVPGTTYRRLYIPKNTVVTVDEIEFLSPIGINIIFLANGSIRLEYDLRQTTELMTIEQNAIPWQIATYDGVELFQFEIPLLQLKYRKFEESATPNRAFKQTISLDKQRGDMYHHCDVYSWINGTRQKLNLTLSQDVKDINKPTAIVTVNEMTVDVEIPLIYFSKGLIGSEIEIDIYVTRGDITIDLSSYVVDSFSLRYGDESEYADKTDGNYFNPLSTVSYMGIFSTDTTTGGSNEPTFAELKEFAVHGTNVTQPAITQNQLVNRFNKRGYDLTVELDRLLERSFTASKDLPRDTTNEFNTGISCGITTVSTSVRSMIETIDTVRDNDKRVTLLPGTLFEVTDLPYVVPRGELPSRGNVGNTTIANRVNEGNYVFNPFHYVIDMSEDRLDLRPYQLLPDLISRKAVAINADSQFSMSTLDVEFDIIDEGYVLYLNAKVSDNILHNRLFAQLSFKAVEDTARTWLPGTLVSVDEGIARFKFMFESDFDIDRYNSLFIENFNVFGGDITRVRTELTSEFSLVYGIYDSTSYVTSNIDNLVNFNVISGQPMSLTHEKITLKFGEHLDTLWAKSRNIASSLTYEYYTEDVPYLHEETVPEKDENGRLILEDTPEGKRPRLKYRKGDPVLDENGDIIYRYKAGTVKRDPETNNPVLQSPNRNTDRMLQLFTMDANYLFSSAPTDINYKDFIIQSVVDICTKDMRDIAPDLGENTDIYFYPTNSVGTVNIIDNESISTRLNSNVSFEVTVYMTEASVRNDVLRTSLEKGIKRILSEHLSKQTVAKALIEKEIKDTFNEDIISVRIDSDFTALGIDIFSTEEKSSKLTIRRKLSVLEDDSLYVLDDVTIVPKVHD